VSRKTVGNRLFGLGRLPRRARPALEAEGIRLLDEGIRADLTLRRIRAPGRFILYRREFRSGAIAVTAQRVVAFVWWGKLFDVPLGDPNLEKLEITVPRPGILAVSFDVGDFEDGRTGRITCRFSTDLAAQFARLVSPGR